MIEALIKKGFTQSEIAKRCGWSQSNVSRIKRGIALEVKLSVYVKLEAMHEKHCAKKRKEK